ncbi:MAG TPA: transporter substrate-binding domain-containing protein [Stellaceae bacterium]|nr:transporter substrate-binding domain-containing protein [Stellaceae bacterium]
MGKAVKLVLALVLVALGASRALAEDTLAKVKAAGQISVGVKNDYRPWGFLDSSGQIVGMEIDLARDVARRLGVGVRLVPVIASNRMEFLQQGNIDLIIATMGDTPERRKVVGMVEPDYYAGGTNILAPKSAHFHAWTELKGKRVCAVEGAYYNRRVAQLYQPELVTLPAVPEAMKALQGGNCVAFLFDDTLIQSTLAAGDPQWADYEMPLPSEDPQKWAIGVRLDDLNGPFGEFMKKTSEEWHRTGYLVDEEKKWGIKPSPYLAEMHAKYSAK